MPNTASEWVTARTGRRRRRGPRRRTRGPGRAGRGRSRSAGSPRARGPVGRRPRGSRPRGRGRRPTGVGCVPRRRAARDRDQDLDHGHRDEPEPEPKRPWGRGQGLPGHPGQSRALDAPILGETVYPDLDSIPVPVDVVDVFRRPEEVPEIANAAARDRGEGPVAQLGIRSPEGAAIAGLAGLTFIEDRCMKIAIRNGTSRCT